MEKILSVIIPVYNVENYIRKCLSSLIIPEYLDALDIVIVNDGTPDKSAKFAMEYEKNYPGIFRVINQENRGHGGAWNTGLAAAYGKYIFFLDSDDWVDTDSMYYLVKQIQSINSDLIFIDSQTYWAETKSYTYNKIINIIPNKIYNSKTFDWINTPQIGNFTYITHCIIKAQLLKPHLPIFLEHVRYDDIILEGLPIILAESFVYFDFSIYNYYKGREGQSYDPKVRAKHYDDVNKNVKHAMVFLQKNTPTEISTRRDFGVSLYQSFGTYHFEEICREPIKYAKANLPIWDKMLQNEFADIQISKLISLYRRIPFFIFISLYKGTYLLKKTILRIKKQFL